MPSDRRGDTLATNVYYTLFISRYADIFTQRAMLSEELLGEAVLEFSQLSLQESEQIRHKSYDIYQWTENDRIATTQTITVPSVKRWAENPPDEATKIEQLIETLVTDDDIPLIQSEMAARSYFENLIRALRIEFYREDAYESSTNTGFRNTLHSSEVTIEYIIPIIGLSFDEKVQITNNLHIRPVDELKKELMLNANTLGGSSVALHRAIELGSLTDVAVYEYTAPLEDGWQNGMGAVSNISKQAQDTIENLRIALRISHPKEFQMGVWHAVDNTFYPTIIS